MAKKKTGIDSDLTKIKSDIKSLKSSIKSSSRDAEAVAKSVKNAKKVATAAGLTGDRVTERQVDRLKETISREKDLSKIVSRLSGTLKASDVNAIERQLTYGKQLASLSRKMAGRVGANEVRILTKALADARDAKKIINAFSGKSASDLTEAMRSASATSVNTKTSEKEPFFKNNPIFESGNNSDLVLIFENILASVSAIPKMAEDIATLLKLQQSSARTERIEKPKRAENELEAQAKRNAYRREIIRPTATSNQSGMATLDFLMAGLGTAGLLASLLKNSNYRNIIDDALQYVFDAVKKEVDDRLNRFKTAAENALKDPTNTEKLAEVGKSGREDLKVTAGPSAFANIPQLFSKIPLLKNLPGVKMLAPLSKVLGYPLAVFSRTFDTLTSLSDEEQKRLGADSKISAGLASALAGNEDDWWVSRMLTGATLGGLAGSGLPVVGNALGALAGGTMGAIGPKRTVATIDTTASDFLTYYRMATDAAYSSVANLYYGYHIKDLEYGLKRAQDKLTKAREPGGNYEEVVKLQSVVSQFERELKKAQVGLIESSFNNTIVRLGDLAKGATEYSERKWKFANAPELLPSEKILGATSKRATPEQLAALIQIESNFNPNAVSPAGAVGLGQFMPKTATKYGITDRRDPKQSLTGSLSYLNDLLGRYNGSYLAAVAAYNVGEGAYDRLAARAGTTDPFQIAQKVGIGPSQLPGGGVGSGGLPIETINHVAKIHNKLNEFESGMGKDKVDYIKNILGSGAFSGQSVNLVNSFNTTTQVNQNSQQQSGGDGIPASITLYQPPNYY